MNNILLFGDLVIDEKISGVYTKIAQEGPFPVVDIKNKSKNIGCCGNVLSNILEFFDNIYFITCINSNEINEVEELISNNKNVKLINFHQTNRHIIRKNRLYCNNTCISRFDEETICDIDNINETKIVTYIESIISNINIVLLSDYNKGTLTENLTLKILELTNKYNIISLIDPKSCDFSKYKNATIVKPNTHEFQQCLKYEKIDTYNDIDMIKDRIIDKYNIKIILNTLADKGMRIFFKNDDNILTFIDEPVVKSNIIDVVGCGDTIIAALCVYISENKYKLNNNYYRHMLNILCKNGKKAVETSGCYILNKYDWNQCYKKPDVVFTNGCFDIVHIGHIKMLKECKKIGSKLIIGINSDESIKRLKGVQRPIHKLQDRIDFLNELNIADQIIPFDEDTPIELIKKIKPNILVKGGDYKKEDIIGKEYVDNVVILKFHKGYSTTNIISRIII